MVMQIKMSKKGVEMTVVFMILVILGGIVLLLLAKDLFGTISEDVEKHQQVCRASIGKAFAGALPCFWDVFPFEFQCKTNPALIDSENKEEVMQQLADEFYTCMWYIDRGKGLSKHECNFNIVRTYGFDWSVIKFGAKTSTLGSITLDEFRGYLEDKKVPNFDGSYYDYLFDADAYFSLDTRDNFNDVNAYKFDPDLNDDFGESVRKFNDEDKIDFSKDYVISYGLFLEKGAYLGTLPGPSIVNFILLSEEGSELHNKFVKRCEYLV